MHYQESKNDGREREVRVREVIDDCLRRRAAGEAGSGDELIAAHPELMPELGEELQKLRLIPASRERVATPNSAETETFSHRDSDTGSSHLEVRCPNCHEPTKVAVDTQLTDLTCSACGSHFSLVNQSQDTRIAPSLSKMGRFELIERLGVGAFGSVWKARDKELDRTIAVKIPRQEVMTTEEQEKFFREARAAAQLSHPGIVSVFEVGREGDVVYIVSDFVRGVTLSDWLTGQQLTSREAAELCAKIADALHHAHEKGVVHRDLKPANIMIDCDGEPQIMDFGLARRDIGEVTITMDGHPLGTPAYMPPEQAEGKGHQADRRSDVYSLGVILFQLLTCELPFRGNARMLMHQVIHNEPPSPRELNANIAKDMDTITLKCMEKEPSRRFQSASELADELRRFLSGEPIRARPIGSIERSWRWCRRNSVVAALSCAVVLVLGAGTVISAYYAIEAETRAQEAEVERSRVITEQARTLAAFRKARGVMDESINAISKQATISKSPEMQQVHLRLLESASQYYEEFANGTLERDPSVQISRAQANLRLGSLRYSLGDLERAESLYDTAIAKLEKLVLENPTVFDYQMGLCNARLEWSAWQRSKGSIAEAESNITKVIAIWEELAGEYPTDQRYQSSLAGTYRMLGDFQRKAERSTDAEKSFTRAIEILESLFSKNRANRAHQNDFLTLSDPYKSLGDFQRELGHVTEAERSYFRAIEIDKMGVREAADDQVFFSIGLNRLLSVYASLDELQRETGHGGEADESYAELFQFLEQLARKGSTVPDFQISLAKAYRDLGSIQKHASRVAAGESCYSRAIELCQNLARSDPTTFQHDLAEAYVDLAIFQSETGRQVDSEETWSKSAQSFLLILEREPDSIAHWLDASLSQLALGNVDEYRRLCRELLSRFGDTNNPRVAEVVGFACVAAPGAIEDSEVLVRVVKRHVATMESNEWRLGAALYRAGRFQEAIEKFDAAVKNGSAAGAWGSAFLAMAHHSLDHSEQAVQWLAEAKHKQHGTAGWYERVAIDQLVREAESLIGTSPEL